MHAQSEMNRVVEQYASTLLRTAYSFLKNKDDAEDAVQDAFIRYMEKAPDFDSPSHEKAWLLRVTINVCKNHMASSWFRKRAELSEDIPALEPEEKTVLETVLKLPQKYRSVIHLYYYEGYSLAEIAGLLQCPVSTVTTRLSRARKRLSLLLEGDEFEL